MLAVSAMSAVPVASMTIFMTVFIIGIRVRVGVRLRVRIKFLAVTIVTIMTLMTLAFNDGEVGSLSFDDEEVVVFDSVDLVSPARLSVEGDLDLAFTIFGVDIDGKRDIGRREVNEVDEVETNGLGIGLDEIPFDDDLLTRLDFGVLLREDKLDSVGYHSQDGQSEKKPHVAGWIGWRRSIIEGLQSRDKCMSSSY